MKLTSRAAQRKIAHFHDMRLHTNVDVKLATASDPWTILQESSCAGRWHLHRVQHLGADVDAATDHELGLGDRPRRCLMPFATRANWSGVGNVRVFQSLQTGTVPHESLHPVSLGSQGDLLRAWRRELTLARDQARGVRLEA